MTHDNNQNGERKQGRSFPWVCGHCGQIEVRPHKIHYQANIKHDGQLYTFVVPDLLLPTCNNCGEQVFTNRAGDQVQAAFEEHLKLLAAKES